MEVTNGVSSEWAMSGKDVTVIGLILVLGLVGYLAGKQSPLVTPLLPLFSLAYLAAMLALIGICLFAALKHRRTGWISGVLFALIFPMGGVIAWLIAKQM